MQRHEIPNGCLVYFCRACGEYMGAPKDQTAQERADMLNDHSKLCRAARREPCPICGSAVGHAITCPENRGLEGRGAQ